MARIEKIEEVPDAPEMRAARESFIYHDEDGVPHLISAGTTVRVGHPLLDRFGDMFWPASHVDIDWETR